MYAIVPNKLFQVKIYESLQYPLAKTRVIFPAEEMVAYIVIFNEKVVYCVNSKWIQLIDLVNIKMFLATNEF